MKQTPLKRKTPLRAKPMKRGPVSGSKRPTAGSQIRKSAKGQHCMVRLPGVCNRNPETVVAAHIRIPGTAGVGMKPSDLLTVRACLACHDEMDRRTQILPLDDVRLYVHEAHCRQLVEYEREGLVSAS